MVDYLKLMGYVNANPLPQEDRYALTPYFEEMPVWPAPGSVRQVDGIYLVRLSADPDPDLAHTAPPDSE